MSGWDSSIEFTMQDQQQDQWCWAAAAVSIALFYDPQNSPWSQCTLAEAVVPGAQNCCPKNPLCNKQQPLDAALSQTQNFNLEVPGPIAIAQIADELSNRRAVAARMNFSGTGHFVVISAVMVADQMLRICDPQNGTTTTGYNEFSTHYLGKGTWSSSLFHGRASESRDGRWYQARGRATGNHEPASADAKRAGEIGARSAKATTSPGCRGYAP